MDRALELLTALGIRWDPAEAAPSAVDRPRRAEHGDRHPAEPRTRRGTPGAAQRVDRG